MVDYTPIALTGFSRFVTRLHMRYTTRNIYLMNPKAFPPKDTNMKAIFVFAHRHYVCSQI